MTKTQRQDKNAGKEQRSKSEQTNPAWPTSLVLRLRKNAVSNALVSVYSRDRVSPEMAKMMMMVVMMMMMMVMMVVMMMMVVVMMMVMMMMLFTNESDKSMLVTTMAAKTPKIKNSN